MLHAIGEVIRLEMNINLQSLNIAHAGNQRQHENQEQKNHPEQDKIILHLIAHRKTGQHQKSGIKPVTIGQNKNLALLNQPCAAGPFAAAHAEILCQAF